MIKEVYVCWLVGSTEHQLKETRKARYKTKQPTGVKNKGTAVNNGGIWNLVESARQGEVGESNNRG